LPLVVLVGILKERNTLDLTFSLLSVYVSFLIKNYLAFKLFLVSLVCSLLNHYYIILFFVEIAIFCLLIVSFFAKIFFHLLKLLPYNFLFFLFVTFFRRILSLLPKQLFSFALLSASKQQALKSYFSSSFKIFKDKLFDFDFNFFVANLKLHILNLEDMKKAVKYFFFAFFFVALFICFSDLIPTIASFELSDINKILEIKEQFHEIQKLISLQQISFRDLISTRKNFINSLFFTSFAQNESSLTQIRSYPFDINQNSPIFEETLEFMLTKLNEYYQQIDN
jgi:hypothetical protein